MKEEGSVGLGRETNSVCLFACLFHMVGGLTRQSHSQEREETGHKNPPIDVQCPLCVNLHVSNIDKVNDLKI